MGMREWVGMVLVAAVVIVLLASDPLSLSTTSTILPRRGCGDSGKAHLLHQKEGETASVANNNGDGCRSSSDGVPSQTSRQKGSKWREPYVHPYKETFSSHHCLGHNKGWELRRCKFNYVCSYHGGLWYFVDPDEARQQPVDTNTKGIPSFPGATPQWLSADTRGMAWGPSQTTKSVEAFAAEAGARVQWHAHPLFFLVKHACANAGHCVLENMFPVFVDLLTWIIPPCNDLGCNPYNNTILMLEHGTQEDCGCGSHQLSCGTGAAETPDRCRHFVSQTLGLMSDQPPTYINLLPSFSGNLMECWPEAYAGHGAMLPYMNGMSVGMYNHGAGYLRLMRDAVYERVGVAPTLLGARHARLLATHTLRVLAAKKTGRRVIANFEDAVGWLQGMSVQIDGEQYSLDVNVISWYDYPTTKAQVELLGDTDIYFTSAGSASIQALFLPDYTAMVTTVFCDPRNGHIEVGYCDSFEHQIVHTHASTFHSYIYTVDSLDELPDSAAPGSKDIRMMQGKTVKLVSQAATSIIREVLAAAAMRDPPPPL